MLPKLILQLGGESFRDSWGYAGNMTEERTACLSGGRLLSLTGNFIAAAAAGCSRLVAQSTSLIEP
jgi:hypothetical protein